jgi:putative two-component system response regulator
LQNQNEGLEVKVRERTRDLEAAQIEILQRLSLAAEFRDDDTGQHTQRVGRTSTLMAQALGLPDDLVELVRLAAPLHDVGKIGIPDAILLKPSGLAPDEFRVMTTHTSIGGQLLSGSEAPCLRLAEEIALSHHECWNGAGYPLGRRREEIPLAGRIVSVADVYDALTHRRPYKKAWPPQDAAAEIERLGRSKFDPQVVAAFLHLLRDRLLPDDAPVGEAG